MADLPLVVLGIDHHRTPVGIRERLAIADSDLGDLLAGLVTLPGCSEAVALSTCNRVECYLAGAPDRDQVLTWLCERRGVPPDVVEKSAYWKRGADGVRHLFRVASGLESLVIGESQIVNQVKSAYEAALSRQVTGVLLNPLFQRALAAGKDVRTQTAIGRHRLSVASVAVELAEHIHGDLASARLLVVGAGEIAELAVKHLLSAGVRQITLINRTHERALALAEGVPAKVLEWSALTTALAEHDIVVASTAAPQAVITEADVRQAMRHRRAPLLLIDLAVPRDIHPSCREVAATSLYDMDDLQALVERNVSGREAEARLVEAIVRSETARFDRWLGSQDVTATIAALRARADEVVERVLAENAGRWENLEQADAERLAAASKAIASRLLHEPTLRLKRAASEGDAYAEVAVLRELFGLDVGSEPLGAAGAEVSDLRDRRHRNR